MTDQNESSRCWNTDVSHEVAEYGSVALRKAMRVEFKKLAIHHGISVKDATLLLMNGVSF